MTSNTPLTDAFENETVKDIPPADTSHWYKTALKAVAFARTLELKLAEKERELETVRTIGNQTLLEKRQLQAVARELARKLDYHGKSMASMVHYEDVKQALTAYTSLHTSVRGGVITSRDVKDAMDSEGEDMKG